MAYFEWECDGVMEYVHQQGIREIAFLVSGLWFFWLHFQA
jgi:hypothetical protein